MESNASDVKAPDNNTDQLPNHPTSLNDGGEKQDIDNNKTTSSTWTPNHTQSEQNPQINKYIKPDGNSTEMSPNEKQFVEFFSKTKQKKGWKDKDFYKKKRHYFILTDGGKPVFSRYGDEVENCSWFATFSAITTKFTIFQSTEESKADIHYISNITNVMVFSKKGHLIFIAWSKKGDSISHLNTQLDYLYYQLMSLLTTQFFGRLEENPSWCLSQLSDTEILFEHIIQYTSKSMVSVLGSYQVLPFENRSKVNNICSNNIGEAVLCVILTPNEIIGISNRLPIQPYDIILLQNLIKANPSLTSTESWLSICLPGIADNGYLQLYVNFSENKIGVCLLTDSTDVFMSFKSQAETIQNELLKDNWIGKIAKSLPQENRNKTELTENEEEEWIDKLLLKLERSDNKRKSPWNELKHSRTLTVLSKGKNWESVINTPTPESPLFWNDTSSNAIFGDIAYGICKHRRLNQFFWINFNNNFYNTTKEEKALYREYISLWDKWNKWSEKEEKNNVIMHTEKGEIYSNIIQQNENYIWIASFNFFIDIDEMGNQMKDIFKYVKSNENLFFINIK